VVANICLLKIHRMKFNGHLPSIPYSNRVGCAMVTCPSIGQYWHCTWAPRGNFRGLQPFNSTCVPQTNPRGNSTCGRVSDGCKTVQCGPPCNPEVPLVLTSGFDLKTFFSVVPLRRLWRRCTSFEPILGVLRRLFLS
jgi:hypothetical protein